MSVSRPASARPRQDQDEHAMAGPSAEELAAMEAHRIDWARMLGADVDEAPDLGGLLGYIDRLKGTGKLRPDSKLVVSRDWSTPEMRLNGALQLSTGLARVAAAGERSKELVDA